MVFVVYDQIWHGCLLNGSGRVLSGCAMVISVTGVFVFWLFFSGDISSGG
jgi:hypothetical protein